MDDALYRLEQVLGTYPFDRALPALEVVLLDAGVPASLLTEDDRARKLIHEAIVARPYSDVDEVVSLRNEVDLLVLEIDSLLDVLRDPTAPEEDVDQTVLRLAAMRRRLEEVQAKL